MWRKQIGYLAQTTAIYGRMTVREYLNYMLLLSGFTKDLRRKILIDEVVELFSLCDYHSEPAGQLSGGIRQRIGLAQAFVHKPGVLLLDEPVNFLDSLERMRIQNLLLTHFKDRIILYVGHIINEMDVFCSEVVILHRQKCIYMGKPGELKNYALGRARYIYVDPDTYNQRIHSDLNILQLFSYDHQLGVKFDGLYFQDERGVAAEITLQDAYQIFLNDFADKP